MEEIEKEILKLEKDISTLIVTQNVTDKQFGIAVAMVLKNNFGSHNLIRFEEAFRDELNKGN